MSPYIFAGECTYSFNCFLNNLTLFLFLYKTSLLTVIAAPIGKPADYSREEEL